MGKKIRYGDFIHEMSANHQLISYNDLAPKPVIDTETGRTIYPKPTLTLRPSDLFHLLFPYLNVRFIAQVKAVVPLALYLILFQIIVLRQTVQDATVITLGMLAVIIGLMVFMEGLKLGLMPFGELIGNNLPKKSKLGVVLFIVFLLGIGVTFAEPAIGALQAVGSIVDIHKAPYLYALLNMWTSTLVLFVGIGVGIAAVIGTMRFLYGWSLKPLVYLSLLPTLGLSIYCQMHPDLNTIVGLAWDCGAVTTGPITVPLVLSLGIGIAAAAGKGDSSLSGFGIVTLASLFPIIAVFILSIYLSFTLTPESIIAAAEAQTLAAPPQTPWYELTPFAETIAGLRAIVPLVLFLFFVLKVVLKENVPDRKMVLYGLSLSVIGMIIFNVGLSYGLSKLGTQSGSLIPAAFTMVKSVTESPLYIYSVGIGIALIFAWCLGFGATIAEPALNALGITVETLTSGTFKKSMLINAVSVGVGFGITLGVIKIIYNIPLAYFLLPGYLSAILLTYFSSEEFVNVAWDSAGVTTGPITVPLVLAMGLGFGDALHSVEGFGILSMASICPILSVLLTGLWVELRIKLIEKEETKESITEESLI